MRIAFIDAISWDYVIESAWQTPLGGTQSGLCYLAANLAKQGHEVWLINQCQRPQISRGVSCAPIGRILQGNTFRDLEFDAVVVIGSAQNGRVVRALVGEQTQVVLWSGHAADQPCVEALKDPEIRAGFDAFALVSEWQRGCYVREFGLPLERTQVLRNAIAPAFESGVEMTSATRGDPSDAPILAYTSTPFRGLDLLVEVFPKMRARFPGLRLKVFSSMKVYRMDDSQDAQEFGALYAACRSTEGIDYVGAIPQPELAAALQEVSILAYPNIYPETSCIAVMEAMASGCQVVTSELGALPETTAGFARLANTRRGGERFLRDFEDQLAGAIGGLGSAPHQEKMRRQSRFVAEHYTWGPRAQEWVHWLSRLKQQARAA